MVFLCSSAPYTVAGAHIAVWLVNHPAADAPALAAVLRSYDVHEPEPTSGQALAVRPWASALREVFEAPTVAGKAELTDALLVAADCRPRLVSHGPDQPYHFHYAPVLTGLAARVRALTAAGLGHVIDGGAGVPAPGVQPGGMRGRLHRHLAQRDGPATSAPSAAPTRSTWPTTGNASARPVRTGRPAAR